MSHRLTAEELTEPDVTLTIPAGRALPREIWEDLRACCISARENPDGSSTIRLPAYRLREIEQRMREMQ